jgi:hypothetical protein
VIIYVSGSNAVNAKSICASLSKNALFVINQIAPDSGTPPGLPEIRNRSDGFSPFCIPPVPMKARITSTVLLFGKVSLRLYLGL